MGDLVVPSGDHGHSDLEAITENHDPATGLDTVSTQAHHPDRVRKHLAYASVTLVFLAMIGGFIGWLLGKPVGEWATFTTPIFTLAGVALAFYFSERH